MQENFRAWLSKQKQHSLGLYTWLLHCVARNRGVIRILVQSKQYHMPCVLPLVKMSWYYVFAMLFPF